MRVKWKILGVCIAIPLIVGGISALLTMGGMAAFQAANKPPLTPPGWLFPLVWTILYMLMGIASYLVITSGKNQGEIIRAWGLYALQLAVNFFWSIIFFNWEAYLLAFFWLVLLWVLIIITQKKFGQLVKAAGYLLFPYIIWVTFAGYLNFGVYLLN